MRLNIWHRSRCGTPPYEVQLFVILCHSQKRPDFGPKLCYNPLVLLILSAPPWDYLKNLGSPVGCVSTAFFSELFLQRFVLQGLLLESSLKIPHPGHLLLRFGERLPADAALALLLQRSNEAVVPRALLLG